MMLEILPSAGLAEFGIAPNSSPLQGDANLSQLFSRGKLVPPRGNAPRSIGYRPIALLLSDGGENLVHGRALPNVGGQHLFIT